MLGDTLVIMLNTSVDCQTDVQMCFHTLVFIFLLLNTVILYIYGIFSRFTLMQKDQIPQIV